MPLTLACAYGLMTNPMWSMPGSWISSTYCEDPVIRRGSSRRLTGWPISFGNGAEIAIGSPPWSVRWISLWQAASSYRHGWHSSSMSTTSVTLRADGRNVPWRTSATASESAATLDLAGHAVATDRIVLARVVTEDKSWTLDVGRWTSGDRAPPRQTRNVERPTPLGEGRMARLTVGVVGIGFVGAAHVDAIRRIPNVDVVAVASASSERATRHADELGISRAYGDYRELIADPEIDIVHNCTPNVLHLPVNRAILEAGKACYAEKPLAMDAAEANDLVEIGRASCRERV